MKSNKTGQESFAATVHITEADLTGDTNPEYIVVCTYMCGNIGRIPEIFGTVDGRFMNIADCNMVTMVGQPGASAYFRPGERYTNGYLDIKYIGNAPAIRERRSVTLKFNGQEYIAQ